MSNVDKLKRFFPVYNEEEGIYEQQAGTYCLYVDSFTGEITTYHAVRVTESGLALVGDYGETDELTASHYSCIKIAKEVDWQN